MLRDGPSVLAVGPHVDDVELGCGGSLLRFKREFRATVHVAVFSDHYQEPTYVDRKREAERAGELFGYDTLEILDHKDTEFPQEELKIQERLRRLRRELQPDLVLAPNPSDTHQDHRVLADCAIREFRYGEVLWHYEINQFGVPNRLRANTFVSLDGSTVGPDPESLSIGQDSLPAHILSAGGMNYAKLKVVLAYEAMVSQRNKPLLDPELMLAVMRVRAIQRDNQAGYCEAFSGRINV